MKGLHRLLPGFELFDRFDGVFLCGCGCIISC